MYKRLRRMNIYWARVSFPEKPGSKKRPVIYLGQHHGIATVLRVSSQYRKSSWIKAHYFYPLKHSRHTKLYKQSYVDLTRPTYLPADIIKNHVGAVSLRDRIGLCKQDLREHRLHGTPKQPVYK